MSDECKMGCMALGDIPEMKDGDVLMQCRCRQEELRFFVQAASQGARNND